MISFVGNVLPSSKTTAEPRITVLSFAIAAVIPLVNEDFCSFYENGVSTEAMQGLHLGFPNDNFSPLNCSVFVLLKSTISLYKASRNVMHQNLFDL